MCKLIIASRVIEPAQPTEPSQEGDYGSVGLDSGTEKTFGNPGIHRFFPAVGGGGGGG